MWKTTVSVFMLIRFTKHLGVTARDTVPEVLYEPPVPRKEQPRQVLRHEECCPEPHCCSVQKMVLKSQGAAEGELAKGVQAAAALGGTQADYRRAIAENALRRAEEDKYASASILDANVEKDVRVAEAEAAAADKELEEIKKKDEELEQHHRTFAERAIQELEEEATQATDDLQSLEKERRKLAEMVMEHEAEESREEKRAALAQQEAAVGEAAHEELAAQIERTEGEVKEHENMRGREALTHEAQAAEKRAQTAIHRAQSVLAHAREREKNTDSTPANVDTTGSVSVAAQLKENEEDVIAAEHEAEVQKEEEAVAQLAVQSASGYPVLHFKSVPATAHAQAREPTAFTTLQGIRTEYAQVGQRRSTQRDDFMAHVTPHTGLRRTKLLPLYQ